MQVDDSVSNSGVLAINNSPPSSTVYNGTGSLYTLYIYVDDDVRNYKQVW
jgi:hypothetical protein